MMGDEMVRAFRAEEYENGEEFEAEHEPHERESRKVRKDGTVMFRNQTFGPVASKYIGQSVELQLVGDHLDIFHEGELIDSYLWQE
jgi:hypothetical protein